MHEQDELEGDLDAVNQYAEEHAEVWGGVEFDNAARPVRLAAYVVGDVEHHAAALREIAPHPDRRSALMSEADGQALAERLFTRLQSALPANSSFGVWRRPGRSVVVALPHGYSRFEAQVADEYGELVTFERGLVYRPLGGAR